MVRCHNTSWLKTAELENEYPRRLANLQVTVKPTPEVIIQGPPATCPKHAVEPFLRHETSRVNDGVAENWFVPLL
jgi:hypothetical protein